MSDFVKQVGCCNSFEGDAAWVILSPIEQSIKQKIEAVGTPLKDWDIQINYGIKTGCNEAFIVSTEKRDEILANCQTEDERKRTEELIRRISQRAGTLLQVWRVRLHQNKIHIVSSLFSEKKYEPMWI